MLKKEKKIVSVFVALITLFSLLFLPQQTNNVRAAGVERPDVALTSLTLLREDGTTSNTFKYWETVKLNLNWDASMYRNTLKEGDYFTIKLPEGLRFGFNASATHFNVVNRDNIVTANVEVTPTFTGGGTAKVIFTKAVENKYNITGDMSMFSEFVFEKIKSGEKNSFSVDINGKVVTTTDVVVNKQIIDPDEVVTKWSSRTTNPNEATWTMRLNYSKARTYTNVVLSDVLTAKNGSLSGIHYVEGSFILRRVEVNSTGDNIKELERKNISSDVKFNADKTAFTYTMGTIDQNSQYYLEYKTTYVTNVILENKISFVSTEFSKEVTAQYRDFSANGRSDGNDTGILKLIKVDANDQQLRLPGATFKITEVSTQESWTVVTDAQGEITLVNLVPGKYKIEEIAVPKGYVLDPTAHFTDLVQGEVKTVQLTNVKEAPPAGKIEVIKTDAATKAALAGAEFDVKDASGTVVAHLVTDASGHASTKDLPLGKYTIVETKAPTGYVLSKTEEVVDITTKGEVKTVQLTNVKEVEPTGKIEVIKTDAATKAALAGAEFDVKDASGTVVAHLVTDASGHASTKDLPLGKYTIVETKAPTGYVLSKTEEVVDITTKGEVKTVQLTNVKEVEPTGKIEVIKTDAATKAALAGAEFDVKDASGTVVAHLVTDASGHASTKDLPLGKYTIVETKAPTGYVLSKTEEVVDVTTKGEVKTVQLTNVKEVEPTGKIEVIKTDAATKAALADAEFDVKDASGTVVSHLITGKTGRATTKDLPLGKYTIVETKAPKGYVMSNKEEVINITKQGEIVKVEKTNKPEFGKIIVSKFDEETKNRLSGMVFKIRHVESGVEKTVEMKEYNVMELEELPLGTYEITEVTAPAGYDRSTTVYKVALEKDGDEKRVDIFDTRQTQTPKPPVEKEKSKPTTNVISLPKTGAQIETKSNDHTQYFIGSSVAVLVTLSALAYAIRKRKM